MKEKGRRKELHEKTGNTGINVKKQEENYGKKRKRTICEY
jgi:hypothetical protein